MTEADCPEHLTRIDKLQESSPNHPNTIYTKWEPDLARLELTAANQRRWGYYATELASDAEKASAHRLEQDTPPSEEFKSEGDAQDYRKLYYLRPALQVVYCVAVEKGYESYL